MIKLTSKYFTGKNIAVIACDHGLGHIRRSYLISLSLSRANKVTLFAPLSKISKLSLILPPSESISFINLLTKSTPSLFARPFSEITNWLTQLNGIGAYDYVISDNLPEILSLRSDAILSAQFFWHRVVPSNPEYFSFCQKLITDFNPLVFGCKHFAMPHIKDSINYCPVSLYKNPNLIKTYSECLSQKKSDLLITGGSTTLLRSKLRPIVEKYLSRPSSSFRYIHVDPLLLPQSLPSWVRIASYSNEMYCAIKHAVCRPGLGTLTDLLTVGASASLLYESENSEMSHNAFVMLKLSQNSQLL